MKISVVVAVVVEIEEKIEFQTRYIFPQKLKRRLTVMKCQLIYLKKMKHSLENFVAVVV
jgi:hypothetical protein